MKLDHPNLVKFYGAYKDEKRYYIVTELCGGGPLFDMLSSGKKKFFNEKDALRIMQQVFQAVAYCHAQDIIHH